MLCDDLKCEGEKANGNGSYSWPQNWTGTTVAWNRDQKVGKSLQRDKYHLHLCKLVPVKKWEYKYGLLGPLNKPVTLQNQSYWRCKLHCGISKTRHISNCGSPTSVAAGWFFCHVTTSCKGSTYLQSVKFIHEAAKIKKKKIKKWNQL